MNRTKDLGGLHEKWKYDGIQVVRRIPLNSSGNILGVPTAFHLLLEIERA